MGELSDAFHAEHERTYGYRSDGDPIDLVSIRVVARVPCGATPPRRAVSAPATDARRPRRTAYFGQEYGIVSTPVLARADLEWSPAQGPMVIEEYDATCVVPPAANASLDEFENIVIGLEAEEK